MKDMVSATLELLGTDADQSQRNLIAQALKFLSWEDAQGFTPTVLVEHMDHLRGVGQVRPSDRQNVDVRDLGDLSLSVVTIVTDDMPFIIDSVIGALNLENKNPRLVLHPQLWVRRDHEGMLLEILDADPASLVPPGAHLESWVLVELERDFVHEDNTRTANHLREVLRDVRVASSDWQQMRTRALEIAESLRVQHPVLWDNFEANESADLLEWLADDHFLFLGYEDYLLIEVEGKTALQPVAESALGILRSNHHSGTKDAVVLSELASLHARDPIPLVLTKANSRSTVHRTSYLDYLSVRMTDASGTVTGERRFLGLYTGRAHSESVVSIPVLRARLARVFDAMGLAPHSHSARDLGQLIEAIPRDELFASSADQLIELAKSTLHISEQRKVKTYFRNDEFGRYVSAFVYLPRDRYSTDVRIKIQELVRDFYQASSVDFSALVGDESYARLHFIAHTRDEAQVIGRDISTLNQSIEFAIRTWVDDFTELAIARVGVDGAATFLHQFIEAFPESYRASTPAVVGVTDALVISGLAIDDLAIRVTQSNDAQLAEITIIRSGTPIALSEVLPLLQNFGVRVLNEYPFEVCRKGFSSTWILRFGIEFSSQVQTHDAGLDQRLVDAMLAVWRDQAESDPFNALVLTAGMTWQQVAIIRAYAKYMRQIGSAFSQDYIQQVAQAYPHIVSLIHELFDSQFNPTIEGDREIARTSFAQQLELALNDVPVLDHDRILRKMFALVMATLRTSAFMSAPTGDIPRALAFKLDSPVIPELPQPAPLVEIWVYSPRVEGVHLRFGRVARGGLRWSDRREDFRTEVLGLVKAQEVKNAVIVPVGAKGGFVPARLPDPQVDREGWMAAGKAAYREFISSLLDLTDNLHGQDPAPPVDVICRDDADPYLVVAADKGTASFSDIANAIATDRGFWLGDAFASGGSLGYDHKAMGITARGAWISVQRHFRELGINTQSQPFSVVGIGDMSGDVFGNGMLLSDQIRLVAAFDHRDIFIDPTPDASATFKERRRLFELPRSSWADFNAELISEGGGVFSRSAKSIELSTQACEVLGITGEQRSFAPNELIRLILQAPVDLLWNGGIGTYVKAVSESNLDVGDKANDSIRIDGGALRCSVVGEGGNLGFTQLGRIEAAIAGVRINTDAIDNSAGVDTSDHEVNLKILLDTLVRAGELSESRRNEVLAELTDQVAASVLADNYSQNVVLGSARTSAVEFLSVHQRFIADLERRGVLDRALEFLPSDKEIEVRRNAGRGLTSPELAVLLAYAKIDLADELNAANIGTDPWYESALRSYFPAEINELFAQAVANHQLRNQIVTTVVGNQVLNSGGISFIYRVMEETGATAVEAVNAAQAALEVFRISALNDEIDALDNQVPTIAQDAMHLELRRLLDRATRWILNSRSSRLSPGAIVDSYQPVVEKYAAYLREHLPAGMTEDVSLRAARLIELGAPHEIARNVSSSLDLFVLLDIADLSQRLGVAPDRIIPVYLAVTEGYGIDPLLTAISELPRSDRWAVLARQALRADLFGAAAALTERVMTMDQGSTALTIASWEGHYASSVNRAKATLIDIASVDHPDLATLSVALRTLRSLIAQTAE